jgi:hypothetical protein
VAEKGWSGVVIGGVFTLAAAVIGGIFMLLSKDHPPPQSQPAATSLATSPVSSPIAVLPSPTPTPGARQPGPPSPAQPVASDATASGVPRQIVPGQQVTIRGSGFPRGGAVTVTFTIAPREDFPVSSSPQQVDPQGRFTLTFTLDVSYCGYSGRINTYDFGGGGQLLTSNPLAVVC